MARQPIPAFARIAPLNTAVSDNRPERFEGAPGAYGLGAIYSASVEINDALKVVEDPRAISAAVSKKADFVNKKAQAAQAELTRYMDENDKKIRETLYARDEHAAELRAYVRSQKNPFSVVQKAIRDGDLRLVTSVLRAPEVLSGIDADQASLLYSAASQTFCAKEFEHGAKMQRVKDRLDIAAADFSRETSRLLQQIQTSDAAVAEGLLKGTANIKEVA